MRITRVFGSNSPQGPGTGLPSLTSGKIPGTPEGCAVGLSWKGVWPKEQLVDYFTAMYKPYYFTWWHEADNDDLNRDGRIDSVDAQVWREQMSIVVEANAEANNPLYLGCGPILITQSLDLGVNPLDWWVDGCTIFMGDRYNKRADRYRTPSELFDPIIEASQA